MPAPKNHFKANLAHETTQIGLWLVMSTGYAAEVAAAAGFDWLLIDGEHAPNDLMTINEQLTALSGHSVTPIVRIPHTDPALIKQMLDMGVQTLLCPMVNSAQEAREIVQSMRYPPRGIRGVGNFLGRASNFNGISDYMATVEDELCLIVQAESVAAMDALEEICAVDGVDAVFFGPADLCADMGHLPDVNHPEVRASVLDGLKRVRAAGKAAGIIEADPKLMQENIDSGANFIAVGADLVILAGALRERVDRWKPRQD